MYFYFQKIRDLLSFHSLPLAHGMYSILIPQLGQLTRRGAYRKNTRNPQIGINENFLIGWISYPEAGLLQDEQTPLLPFLALIGTSIRLLPSFVIIFGVPYTKRGCFSTEFRIVFNNILMSLVGYCF